MMNNVRSDSKEGKGRGEGRQSRMTKRGERNLCGGMEDLFFNQGDCVLFDLAVPTFTFECPLPPPLLSLHPAY